MTRARLFVLINAFERDVRAILGACVISDLGEEAALGAFYAACRAKQDADHAGSDGSAVAFLEMREGYDLLNTHRGRLPEDLAREVRELTQNLDRLVAIRNRVMHARPLAAGDSDAAVSLLNQFVSSYWREMRRTLTLLHNDPSWEPLVAAGKDMSRTLHNLPLPDYDDTGLVGRSKEVQEVVALLKRGREPVITITGEGGIGKTALAIEVAYRLVDDVEASFDAVLWSSLKYEKLTAYGVREIAGAARDLVGAIQPVGAAIDSGFEGSIRALSDMLDGFNVLVVLDNLETIAGSEFKGLYDALPDSVSYLVTSRIGVGEYERRYPLSTLSDRDAVQLFNQFVRARKIHSLARLTNATRAEVVRKLRTSPLAIKWFALAVEAGNEPLNLLKRQDELLEFCVRSVYDELSQPARAVLDALAVLGRPLTPDQLIVLLEQPIDEINLGVQELMRGSLVRRESLGEADQLTFQLALTETATEFVSRRITITEERSRQLNGRDKELRLIQERRATDIASRSLAPVVVRQRTDADAPTCALLRQALLAAKRGDVSVWGERIDIARKMNPEFWEVDRVEGFVRASMGEIAAATTCYERAYANATGEDRGVVCHFFAGHLARNMRDVGRAIGYAREAHGLLELTETGVALGTYLIWSHQFEEGIALLKPAVAESEGKAKVIAVSALSDGWRRWAEAAETEERNPLRQFQRAWTGLTIALAAIESGVSDERLRNTATDCAAVALRGVASCVRASVPIQGLGDRVDYLGAVAVRLTGCRNWQGLVNESRRLSQTHGAPAASKRLAQSLETLSADTGKDLQLLESQNQLVGEVVHLSTSFGFIRHPAFPNNLFFHAGSVLSEDGLSSLKAGSLVRFVAETHERGPRARDVSAI